MASRDGRCSDASPLEPGWRFWRCLASRSLLPQPPAENCARTAAATTSRMAVRSSGNASASATTVKGGVWSSTGTFDALRLGKLYTYLYDCTSGGLSCTPIATNTAVANPWNAPLLDWTHRVITIGTLNRTIPTGNELRIKLLFHGTDLWTTMTASYASALVVTLG